ncbi:MAG: hypothetical protein LBK01_02605 [Burkholderiaceae bacterium]|jgi:hypothetical protein|nr:hypothetical protein [Burkholderiaceae bacterium]
MSALKHLEKRLQQENIAALAPLLSPHDTMPEAWLTLLEWVIAITARRPAQPHVIAALRAFHQSGQLQSATHARHVCYGSHIPFGAAQPCLIEDPSRFPDLLVQADRFRAHAGVFRRLFHGLLDTYLSYDSENNEYTVPGGIRNHRAGRRNSEQLRQFLAERQAEINITGFKPDWLHAITTHPNLLEQNPCQPYAQAALNGDTREFEEVCGQLCLGQRVWLTRKMVHAQVQEAIRYPDAAFKSSLDHLMALMTRHPWAVDSNLPALIDRYAECKEAPVHPALRDLAISHWKNPCLPVAAPQWRRVRAKNMLISWAKQHLLNLFFRVLAEGHHQDIRRADFWQQYHDAVDEFWFVLDRRDMNSAAPHFTEIRRLMARRLLVMDGMPAIRHACILIAGHHVIVEFVPHGDTYLYDNRITLPFTLKSGSPLPVSASDIKKQDSPAFLCRIPHHDSPHEKWESRLERELSQRRIKKRVTAAP